MIFRSVKKFCDILHCELWYYHLYSTEVTIWYNTVQFGMVQYSSEGTLYASLQPVL